MSTDVASLRAALSDPSALVNALGFERVRRQARGVVVRCPWHDERSGSCSVTVGPDGTVRAHCFGCGQSGDALALIAAVHRLDVRAEFVRVIEIAAGIAGGSFDRAPVPRAMPPEPPRLADEIFARIVECLDPLDADARAYLRRIAGADVSELRSLPRLFADRAIAAVGAAAWERSGLAGFAANRLCIPWRRADGVVHTLQRRRLTAGEPRYVFPRGRSPRHPYGVERVATIGPATAITFCEGAIDTIALRVLSARNGRDWCVLGVPGVSNWDRAWAVHAAGRAAVIALDADAAGESHVADMAADLRRAGATTITRARARTHDWASDLGH